MTLAGDGAELTSDVSHCTVHLKVADCDAVDPFTKKRLFDEEEKYFLMQSRDHCFPVMSYIGKDSKESVQEHVGPLYEKLSNVIAQHNLNVTVVYCGDMKWHWNATGMGGGCKNKALFCHYCDMHTDELHSPSQSSCERCLTRGKQCYHRKCLTESDYDAAQVQLNQLEEEIGAKADDFLPTTLMYIPGKYFCAPDVYLTPFPLFQDQPML